MIERLTLGKSCDHNADEGNDKKPANELQSHLIRSFPYMFREALQELGNCELGYPEAGLVISTFDATNFFDSTYNAAYMIRDAKTNRLPICR